MKLHSLLPFALGILPLAAVEPHFDGWDGKERETEHFMIRAESTGYDPASRHAEKTWDVVLEVLPSLEKDFSENLFRTPDGAKGAEAAPYHHTVYLLGDAHDFDQLVRIDSGRHGWDAGTVRLIKHTGNYSDPHHRYGVFCKVDATRSAGGDRDITAIFVHSTGKSLLSGRSLSRRLPFWMTAGFGYYVEHRLFKRCRVHYIDFESYYRDNEAKFQRGETLGAEDDWTDVLRKLCKKGERVSLEEVCTAQILTLTPNTSGYIFALTCFLVRDDAAREKYRALVEHARKGKGIDKALLLETYGYADDAALEAEWYEWMESRSFR